MSFTLAGRKSTCSLCKNAKNGKAKEGTSKLGILLLYIRAMFQETTGLFARIINVNIDEKGLVCSAPLCTGEWSGNENSKRELECPIDKIVLILGSDKVQFPTKKATCWDKMSYLKGNHVKVHHEGVYSEFYLWRRNCLSNWKTFCNPCVQGPFVKLNWLFLKNMS